MRYRLDKAIEFGADYVIDASKYSVDELKNINDNRLADVVIVCAAAKQAIDNALSSVDRKGKILFFAVPETDISIPSLSSVDRKGKILFFAVPETDINIPSQRFWRDEITVTFSYGASPDDLQKAIELIDSGRVNVRKMITHKIPLSDIGQGFKLAAEAKNSLKVVVVPDS